MAAKKTSSTQKSRKTPTAVASKSANVKSAAKATQVSAKTAPALSAKAMKSATNSAKPKPAPARRKSASTSDAPTPSPRPSPSPSSSRRSTPPSKGKPFTPKELEKFRTLLLELRERLLGDIKFLTTDNLHRAGRETGADLSGASQHSADHGTDNFDREFALSLATTERDVLFEVDEALRRIQDGTYGICELTGAQIERARLEVIPYTRFSVQAQARMEQSRARYRPFAQTFKAW